MQITLLKTLQLKVPSYSIFQHFVCEWGQRLAEMIRKNMTDLYIQRATIKIWSIEINMWKILYQYNDLPLLAWFI